MANRTIQQKIIKMRRRGRYVRFSQHVVNIGDQSLSKQYVDKGLRVPGVNIPNMSLNQDRVRLNPKKDLVTEIPKQLSLTMDKDLATRASILLKDQDLNLKRLIFDGRKVKVFIFFDLGLKNIFLVKIDFRIDSVVRSCKFGSIEQAQQVFKRGIDTVPWLK